MSVVPETSIAPVVAPEAGELLPPQDVAAEQSVLGGMMLSKDAIADVVEALRPNDFYRPAHQAIYEAVLDLYGRGEPVDAITVSAELQRRGELERIGGAPYLHTLIATVPTALNAGYYAEIVAEKALLRRLVAAASRIAQLGYRGGDATAVRDAAEAALYEATAAHRNDQGVDLPDGLDEFLAEVAAAQAGDAPQGVLTGLVDLDEVLHGLQPGELVVVAARPSVGKTALACGLIRAAALRQHRRAVMFSLEMGRTEVIGRIMAAETRTRVDKLAGGRLSADEYDRLTRRAAELAEAPIHIDDSPHLTITEIRSRARRQAARGDLGLIVVDYLQLLPSGKRVESRQQEVAEFSRSLKLLAKELEVPIVALSQLNRGPEQRTDKKPQLGDLRESGAIEQDADIVILIHQPDADQDPSRAGETDLIVAKNRRGPATTITVARQLHYGRFTCMASD